MAGDITIELSGLNKTIAKLAANELYYRPIKVALKEIGTIALAVARSDAPEGKTGRLKGRLRSKVNTGPAPRYAVVKTDAAFRASRPRSRGGSGARGGKSWYPYPYSRRLEFDPKSPHRDWLKGAIDRARGRISSALSTAARVIESEWRR